MTRKTTPARPHAKTVLSLSALALLITGAVLYAGPLDPPAGPVTSTYKTLAEVEPRIAINATNTPGDADSRFKITQPGSYYLTGNITGVSGKHGIEIAASGVTLDLNGFDVVGVPGSLDGVRVTLSNLNSIAITNGSVRNWAGAGIEMGNPVASTSRIAGIRASGNGFGIRSGANSTVVDCVANGNSASGLLVGNNCVVENCTTNSNVGNGTSLGFGVTAANCTSSGNGGIGISTNSGCTISNTNVQNNGTTGVELALNGTVIGCTIIDNRTVGIRSTADGTILNSTISGTTVGSGVSSLFGGLRIENSSINNNIAFGVSVDIAPTTARLSITGCNICGNGSGGVSSAVGTQVLDSFVAENSGIGIRVTGSSLIRGCTINSNTLSGIELTANGNVVQNNTISLNAATVASAAGIRVQGADNTVDSNRLSANAQGSIKINAGGNLALRNSLSGSGAAITAVAGNAVAQILAPGAGFISTDPNANLLY